MKIKLQDYIRAIPDFPKEGILFRDITTLLSDAQAFSSSINAIARIFKGNKVDCIIAAESRGFIFGAALANKLCCGFAPVRKPGKLPHKTYRCSYSLEYGKDSLEIHRDAFRPKDKILIVDDLLATGGTALALAKLVEKMKGDILAFAFLIELTELKGRNKIKKYPVYSLIKY